MIIQWNNLCKARTCAPGKDPIITAIIIIIVVIGTFNTLLSHLSFTPGSHPRSLPLHHPLFPICQYILLILYLRCSRVHS